MSEQVTVRATRRYNGRGGLWRNGEERSVSAEDAAYLVDKKGFERVEADTCDAVKSDGEVCGRKLPCSYHTDDTDEDED